MQQGKLIAYSGMTTKIRAMKKLLLTDEQYDEIAHISTVPDLISYLQSIPTYAEVLVDLDPATTHRENVESRMTFSTYRDFSKIFHFAGDSQKKYLEFYFLKYEIAFLKACMRNIMDSRTESIPILTDKHFRRHSKLDTEKIIASTTMDEFMDSLSGTIYEKLLSKIHESPSPILFDYEMCLDVSFFTYIWKHTDSFVPKGEYRYFENAFGSQIDLLNILWIYRCKNYYVMSDSQIFSYLIPVYYKLEKSTIKAMVEAPDNGTFYALITDSYYGKTYGFDPQQSIEAQFQDILYNIYTKDFKESPYSLTAINAYFNLKNMEVAKVVTALECIRYGYKPEVTSQYIEQKRGVL